MQTVQCIMLETLVKLKEKLFIAQFIISPIHCFTRVQSVYVWNPTSLSAHPDPHVEYLWPPHVPCLLCTSMQRVLSPVCSFHIFYMFPNSANTTQHHSTPHCSACSTFDLSKIHCAAEFHLTLYQPISHPTHHVPHFGTQWHTSYCTARSGVGQLWFCLASELHSHWHVILCLKLLVSSVFIRHPKDVYFMQFLEEM